MQIRRLSSAAHTLHAPDLIFSEFGNVLWKRFRKREISKKEAAATVEAFLSLPLRVETSQILMPVALEIGCGENCTVYDSLYLAAAIVRQIPVVTADAKLYRAIGRGPFSARLLWIEDLPQ